MKLIKQWLKERRNPSLKCARTGHNFKPGIYTIRKESRESRIVCEDYKAKISICTTCGQRKEPAIEKRLDWYTGVTMPGSCWDEIRDHGYLIVRKH